MIYTPLNPLELIRLIRDKRSKFLLLLQMEILIRVRWFGRVNELSLDKFHCVYWVSKTRTGHILRLKRDLSWDTIKVFRNSHTECTRKFGLTVDVQDTLKTVQREEPQVKGVRVQETGCFMNFLGLVVVTPVLWVSK